MIFNRYFRMSLFLGCVVFLNACGKKSSDKSGSSAKAEGDPISLSGSLTIRTAASLGLDDEKMSLVANSGTIKCTYATETEDKADVGADGTFNLSCKAGKPMVMSFFDTDGNPTCSILFKVSQQDTAAATINQDINMGAIQCEDGQAVVDLDVLAPDTAASQTLTQDSSVTLINKDTNHWEFTVEAQVEIGKDGKKLDGKKKKVISKVRQSASLADGNGVGTSKSNKADEVGKTILLTFSSDDCSGNALAAGKMTVYHGQDDQGSGDISWECFENAAITWTGKAFSLNLTYALDVLEEMAKNEIKSQRPEMGPVQFQKVSDDGKSVNVQGAVTTLLEDSSPASFSAPDSVPAGAAFPLEAYCASSKWKNYFDVDGFGKPCSKFKDHVFVLFSKVCDNLADTAASGDVLAKSNVMQCGFTGGKAEASSANANDPSCAADFQDFPGGNSPVEGMSRGVDGLSIQLALIVKLNDLAISGNKDLASAKVGLAAAVKGLSDIFNKVNDQMTLMKAAVAQVTADRLARCAASTRTPVDPTAQKALFAKMDGSKLQPLFDKFQSQFNKLVRENNAVNEAFMRYVSAPTTGFDGSACSIPDGADIFYSSNFIKPTGTCKFNETITIAGVFKDATTIKPMTVTFMDKPDGDCKLSIQHISFDEDTGCWEWDGLKPKLVSESVNLDDMFNGGGIKRQKLIGNAVLTDD